ncbi:hypothetical protein EI94DRAFT_1740356 [Lactarius quietus]|nr:hypothetical protein EI94DRAFT_1740356 [Lactarius quietus]
MAHGRREDQRDDHYRGDSYPRSEDASQHHLSENEHMQGPIQDMAPPASHHLGYAPWNAPPPHPGVQGPSYAMPCANNSALGNGAWHETRRDLPPVPVMSSTPRYTDHGAGEASGATPHQWDNGNPTGVTRVYAPPFAPNSHSNCIAGRYLTPGDNVHSGAGTNAQTYAPSIDAPMPSEFIRSLARRLILDLGTRVDGLNIEASGRGGLK